MNDWRPVVSLRSTTGYFLRPRWGRLEFEATSARLGSVRELLR